jgi:DNA-directed RNA polymerase specialized sigma24 family protein
VQLRKRSEKKEVERAVEIGALTSETVQDGESMRRTTFAAGKGFSEESSTSNQWRTTSLDSMFDEDDGRSAEDIYGWEYNFLSGNREGSDPANKALINDLIEQILALLPEPIHRTCFVLKYVEGYKREDLISCLKMDPKSIDTVDKRIVRALKAFKDKLDQDEARI